MNKEWPSGHQLDPPPFVDNCRASMAIKALTYSVWHITVGRMQRGLVLVYQKALESCRKRSNVATIWIIGCQDTGTCSIEQIVQCRSAEVSC